MLGWSIGSSVALPYKNKKEKGSAGGSPVVASMPKLIPP